MSNQISSQASKLWQTLSAPTTVDTYRNTITLTWQILKETAILIWLVLCLVLVFFDWIGTVAVLTGRNLRSWFASIQETETDQIASDTGKALIEASKNSISYAISTARTQLGLPEKQPLPPPPAPTPAPVPAPASVSVPAPTPTPTVSTPTATPKVEPAEPKVPEANEE